MNDIESIKSEFSELNTLSETRDHNLTHLEEKYVEKGTNFSDNNAKPLVAASALVNMHMPDSKKGIEKSLGEGASLEKALAENKSDLNIDVQKVEASELGAPGGVDKVLAGLEKGNVFLYEDKSGNIRMIYGAEVSASNVGSETKPHLELKGYGGDGFVSGQDVKNDIRNIIANDGAIYQISDAPSRMQELIKSYDNGGRSM